MDGVVVDGVEAVIGLTLVPRTGDPLEVLATVDTGSMAELTLPRSAVRDLDLSWLRTDRVMLADGSFTNCDVYDGDVIWLGGVRTVEVHEADGTPLLGMKLMQGCRLTMDIVPDGRFDIVPLAESQE